MDATALVRWLRDLYLQAHAVENDLHRFATDIRKCEEAMAACQNEKKQLEKELAAVEDRRAEERMRLQRAAEREAEAERVWAAEREAAEREAAEAEEDKRHRRVVLHDAQSRWGRVARADPHEQGSGCLACQTSRPSVDKMMPKWLDLAAWFKEGPASVRQHTSFARQHSPLGYKFRHYPDYLPLKLCCHVSEWDLEGNARRLEALEDHLHVDGEASISPDRVVYEGALPPFDKSGFCANAKGQVESHLRQEIVTGLPIPEDIEKDASSLRASALRPLVLAKDFEGISKLLIQRVRVAARFARFAWGTWTDPRIVAVRALSNVEVCLTAKKYLVEELQAVLLRLFGPETCQVGASLARVHLSFFCWGKKPFVVVGFFFADGVDVFRCDICDGKHGERTIVVLCASASVDCTPRGDGRHHARSGTCEHVCSARFSVVVELTHSSSAPKMCF
jgi:hypothetical protein